MITSRMRTIACATLLLAALPQVTTPAARAAEPKSDKPKAPTPATALYAKPAGDVDEAIERGVRYLLATQSPDGGWQAFGKSDPAITALVVRALLAYPRYDAKYPAIHRGLGFILKYRQPDGGIYIPDRGLRNYYTSISLIALAATKSDEFKDEIASAQKFLKDLQWDESEDRQPADEWYGGQGYGHGKRPDLSNTQMMLEALHQSGLPADDPAFQKAVKFISRCQMLSETNDQPFARGADDGGFIYSPANGGESKAGTTIVHGKPMLRTYGSMTYAGFKSLLYAEVDRKDPRVRRAYEWIRTNYTLDQNPNMPGKQSKQGLFYFYHTFARALHAWGENEIVDAKGKSHNWREELAAKLITLQNGDGSWVNPEDRWYEGNPALVTAYSLRALQTAAEGHKPTGKKLKKKAN